MRERLLVYSLRTLDRITRPPRATSEARWIGRKTAEQPHQEIRPIRSLIVMAANDHDHGCHHAFLMEYKGSRTVATASNISKKDLLKFAAEQDIRLPREIIAQVESALAEWHRIALVFGISKSNAASVQAQHRFI